MGEYFGRCERCRGTQNIAGDPCFSQMDGDAKIPRGTQKIPPGTSRGTSTGSVVEGCLKVEKYLLGPLLSTVDFYKNQKKSRSIIAGIEFKN